MKNTKPANVSVLVNVNRETGLTITNIVSLLEESGCVVTTSNGRMSMAELWQQRTRDLIIAEFTDGNEMTKYLQIFGDGPLIIFIGNDISTSERRCEAIAKGGFDYIQITDLSLLLARSRQLIDLRHKINRLQEDANLDSLSALSTRRVFRLALAKEVERWRRYAVPCTLISVDIDHMKSINDTYGHAAGDTVIRHVGRALAQLSQNNDTASRLGGEEFVLLIAGKTADQVVEVTETLHKLISSDPIENIGRVTVSIGVASCPAHAQSEKALYKASDEALYQAKVDGRHRTVVATCG